MVSFKNCSRNTKVTPQNTKVTFKKLANKYQGYSAKYKGYLLEIATEIQRLLLKIAA